MKMPESEAIEKLRAYHKCQRLQVKGIYEDCNEKLCDNCDLCYAQGNTGEHIESVKVAINALEKQIPKKPRKTNSYRGVLKRVYAYVCPTCGNVCLEKYMNERQNTMFCWNCGQKLDWSEENKADDVCEWKMDNVGADIGCRSGLHHIGHMSRTNCPYCGKKIKVVE